MSDAFQDYLESGGQSTEPTTPSAPVPTSNSDSFQQYLESGGSAPAQQAQVTQSQPTLFDKYKGYLETEAHLASGGIGSLAGGLGYLGSLALTQDPTKAAEAQQKIGGALTYEPRTELGKKWSGDIGNAMGYLGQKGGDIAGSYIAEKTGSPALGAEVNALYNVPQFLLGAKAGESVIPGESDVIHPGNTDILSKGQNLGLRVPPSTGNPTLFNKLAEGAVGKLSTAQSASIKNQPVINSLVRQEIGLPEGAELTPDTLASVRNANSAPYQAVSAIPEIKFGPSYESELGKLTKTSNKMAAALPEYKSLGADQVNNLIESLKPVNGVMDGETAVELSKSLRNQSSAYWQSANRSGDPLERALGHAYSGAAAAVENAVEKHLTDIGKPELANDWDTARRNIAKTYSVQSALDGAGNVDAAKLGKQAIKGKPLSGHLETLADFANAFPKSTNVKWSKESVPGLSPLDVYGGSALGLAAGLHTGELMPAALGATVPLSRMAGRAALLSKFGQRLANPNVETPIVRPVLGALGQSAISGLPGEEQ